MKSFFLILFISLLMGLPLKAQEEAFPSDIEMCKQIKILRQLWQTKYSHIFGMPADGNIQCYSREFDLASAAYLLDNTYEQGKSFLDYVLYYVTGGFEFVDKTNNDENSIATEDFLKKRITLSDNFFKGQPVYARAATLVHETRHIETPYIRHSLCNYKNNAFVSMPESSQIRAKYVGKNGGCDKSFSSDWTSAGAYSFEVMFFRDLYIQDRISVNKAMILNLITLTLETSFNSVSREQYEYYTRP